MRLLLTLMSILFVIFSLLIPIFDFSFNPTKTSFHLLSLKEKVFTGKASNSSFEYKIRGLNKLRINNIPYN